MRVDIYNRRDEGANIKKKKDYNIQMIKRECKCKNEQDYRVASINKLLISIKSEFSYLILDHQSSSRIFCFTNFPSIVFASSHLPHSRLTIINHKACCFSSSLLRNKRTNMVSIGIRNSLLEKVMKTTGCGFCK